MRPGAYCRKPAHFWKPSEYSTPLAELGGTPFFMTRFTALYTQQEFGRPPWEFWNKSNFSACSAFSALKRPFSNVDPKPPLPLRERFGVRGNENNFIKIQTLITPTLPSPVKGEEKKGTPWLE